MNETRDVQMTTRTDVWYFIFTVSVGVMLGLCLHGVMDDIGGRRACIAVIERERIK